MLRPPQPQPALFLSYIYRQSGRKVTQPTADL